MRELSSVKENVRVLKGKPYVIRWNAHTRAWHIHKFSSEPEPFIPVRGTIRTAPHFPELIIKHWEYDPTRPEKLAFHKLPEAKFLTCNNFHGALGEFADYVNSMNNRALN